MLLWAATARHTFVVFPPHSQRALLSFSLFPFTVNQDKDTILTTIMVLPVEFKPPTMYSTRPEMRAEIEKLAQKHYQDNLLGKDGKIYDKAVVM